jgi:GAF domain-containing protein
MHSKRSPSAPTTGVGHAGGIIYVPDVAGEPAGKAADAVHLTQAERAERALAEGRRERSVPIDRAFLQSTLDFRQTLRVIVSAVVPRFADWCFVDLIDGDGIPRRVEVAHADPERAPLAAEMRSISFGPGWATPGAHAIRDGAPRLFREITDEVMAWATSGERHLAVLKAIRPNSLLSVPLIARDRAIGAITVIRSAMQPGLDEGDLVFAEDLAAPAALALDNARWYQAERAARASAEDLADRERNDRILAEGAALRLRRLESISASLAGHLSPSSIARVALENGMSLLGPSTATVVRATRGGDALELLHAQGWPDDLALHHRVMPADTPAVVAEAYRIGTAIWLSSMEALEAAYPNATAIPKQLGDQSWAAVPLRVDGRVIGAVGLGFPLRRELDAEERRFVLAVAQLMAQALERAQLRDER